MNALFWSATVALLATPALAAPVAGPLAAGQHAARFVSEDGRTHFDYLVYLPDGYAEAETPLPLLVFLHGSGQRGRRLDAIKKHGPPNRLEGRTDFPFIVVSPQLPRGERWMPGPVIALLDHVQATWPVDPSRVYLTGLSLGAFGTWRIAAAYPERFAAIAPIAGNGRLAAACDLRDVPTWAFHGDRDPGVSVPRVRRMIDAQRACGGDARLTVYPGVKHDSWTRTYDDPALYEWLLRHRRLPPVLASLAFHSQI